MNDVKYKKSIKRSFVLFGIGIFVIFLILIYTSLSPNSKTTIYDEYDVWVVKANFAPQRVDENGMCTATVGTVPYIVIRQLDGKALGTFVG